MIRTFCAAAALLAASPALAAEPDGLVLPPGFHASVVADGLKGLRHLAFRNTHQLYASTRGVKGAGILALHLDDNHKADRTEHFGTVEGGTGIGILRGQLYAATPTTIYRYRLDGDDLVPSTAPEVIVDGMPEKPSINRAIALNDRGDLFVAVPGQTNNCTAPDAQKIGLQPCPELQGRGGIWRFSASRTGQSFASDGTQLVTGLRDMDAMDWRVGDGLYAIQHGRGGMHELFPTFAADDEAIAEEMHKVSHGANFGWPYSYWDTARNVRLTAPEYGGDGKASPTIAYTAPVAVLPGHAAPLDMVFYRGTKFPRPWRDGAFVALHGGQGATTPQGHHGYNITYVPFDRGGRADTPVIFANNFAGPDPSDRSVAKAAYRPVGVTVGPDGALYVADSNKGRIWRIAYGD